MNLSIILLHHIMLGISIKIYNQEEIIRGYIAIINNKGERLIVNSSEYEGFKSTVYKEYKYDINWYLSHGFIEAKRMFDEIEGKI